MSVPLVRRRSLASVSICSATRPATATGTCGRPARGTPDDAPQRCRGADVPRRRGDREHRDDAPSPPGRRGTSAPPRLHRREPETRSPMKLIIARHAGGPRVPRTPTTEPPTRQTTRARRRTSAAWLRAQLAELETAVVYGDLGKARIREALARIRRGEPWAALPVRAPNVARSSR